MTDTKASLQQAREELKTAMEHVEFLSSKSGIGRIQEEYSKLHNNLQRADAAVVSALENLED